MLENLRILDRAFLIGAVAGAACASVFILGLTGPRALRAVGATPVTPLLASSETVLGEPIVYPRSGTAKITAAVVTLAPGQETGWHTHGSPVFGYVLEGALEVNYGDKGVRVYRAGEAVLEAIATPHNGRNAGNETMKILAVFVGALGVPTTQVTGPPN